jgi:hypothetical protein
MVLEQEATVGQLQQKVERLFKIDRDQQRLVLEATELTAAAPSRRLERLGVEANSVIMCYPKSLTIRVSLPLRRVMTFTDAVSIMTVLDLKCRIEIESGVVVQQQRLGYLESTDLPDGAMLADHDLVNGATMQLTLWDDFLPLYDSIMTGETSKCVWQLLALDSRTTKNPTGQSALDLLAAVAKEKGRPQPARAPSEPGWALLYLAAHLGEEELVHALLELGENGGALCPHGNANRPWPGPGRSPYGRGNQLALPPPSAFRIEHGGTGRTPCHAAAFRGRVGALKAILDSGSGFLLKDADQMSPEALSKRGNHFECAELLALATWQFAMGRWKSKFQDDDLGEDVASEEMLVYGPFHSFEVSFGRNVPPGSNMLKPVDPRLWLRGAPPHRPKRSQQRMSSSGQDGLGVGLTPAQLAPRFQAQAAV